MNEQFSTPHPSFFTFCVQIIELKARNQVQRLDNIRFGRVVPRELEEIAINAVPLCYSRFE